MMTDEQKRQTAELRAAIEAAAPTREGAPTEVRAAAVALKRELRASGTATARELVEALGVHESTLCRWEREPSVSAGRRAASTKRGRGRGAGFRMVQVTPPGRAPSGATPVPVSTTTTRAIRVAHAPSGLVIDGLDVEALSALLRSMS